MRRAADYSLLIGNTPPISPMKGNVMNTKLKSILIPAALIVATTAASLSAHAAGNLNRRVYFSGEHTYYKQLAVNKLIHRKQAFQRNTGFRCRWIGQRKMVRRINRSVRVSQWAHCTLAL